MIQKIAHPQSQDTLRCPKCSRILCQARLVAGVQITVKCACNTWTTIVVVAPQSPGLPSDYEVRVAK